MSEPRRVYFIQETVKTEAGEYIPCIAVEGEKGFYRTDWAWGKDRKIADQFAMQKNELMGYDPKVALTVVLGTMGEQK